MSDLVSLLCQLGFLNEERMQAERERNYGYATEIEKHCKELRHRIGKAREDDARTNYQGT